MRLTIVNLMQSVPMKDFMPVIGALQRQTDQDFTPEWHVPCMLRGVTDSAFMGKVRLEGVHDAIIYVGDSSADPTTGVDNALGYHFTNHSDVPYGFVYLDVVKQAGESWTVTLSHEVLELLADPTAARSVMGPDPRNSKRRVLFDLEVCDPTQGDTYQIDGIPVSNFVTQAWFGLMGPSKTTNFLGLPLRPFHVRPGGYFQYSAGGRSHTVQGERYDAAARAIARQMMGSGRRNSRRAEAREHLAPDGNAGH